MSSINAFLAVALASVPAGWITGQLWILGNHAATAGVGWLIVIALPTNLMVAAIYYYLLRGMVHRADGGIGLYIVFAVANLVISLGAAVVVADSVGAGNAAKIGAHTFSWGMSYAYGQTFHDVRHGTWLHE
jgi:hypothetical protein